MATTCNDRAKDGDETDIDCGGATCAACGEGKTCAGDADCDSQSCDAVALLCSSFACVNHRQDVRETDVDCGGGACPRCANTVGCAVDIDCLSGNCDAGSHTCQPPSCADGKLDGDETSVDCGGATCAGCALGQSCLRSRDCASTGCNPFTRKCITPTCFDQLQDGDETGQDCGGGACPPCDSYFGCKVDADCTSTIAVPNGASAFR